MPWGRILMIEEDTTLRRLVADYFAQRGIQLITMPKADRFAINASADVNLIIISDTAAEYIGVLSEKLGKDHTPPIILMRSIGSSIPKNTEAYIDEIKKPFDISVLYDKAVSMLPYQDNTAFLSELQYNGLSVCLKSNTVTEHGNHIAFSIKETQILHLLMSEPDRLFSREEIASRIWGRLLSDDRTVSVHVNHIRTKLPQYKDNIVSVRGRGYMFRR